MTWLLVAVVAIFSTVAATWVVGAAGANLGIRSTARSSAILFLLAIVASSLYQLWPTTTTHRRHDRAQQAAVRHRRRTHAVGVYVIDFIAKAKRPVR